MKYITENGIKYRIRGQNTASQLRQLYKAFMAEVPGSKLTFRGWLVGFGKVRNRV